MYCSGELKSADSEKRHLLTAGDVQVALQLADVAGHLLEEQLEPVADDVDLLLGLQAVLAHGVDQQLQRHVLQGSHLQLRVQQLAPDLLKTTERERLGGT